MRIYDAFDASPPLTRSHLGSELESVDGGWARSLASIYMTIKESLLASGYSEEIDWQESIKVSSLTEQSFLREAAWVVLGSGFRESIVRRIFPKFSTAFFDWSSAGAIVGDAIGCRSRALEAFPNRRKIAAILEIATIVWSSGFDEVKKSIHNEGLEFLIKLPFIGKVTSYHLAKNLGMEVVKPDRHLVRVARAAGLDSPHELCTVIARIVGDPLAVVDLVIWRYASLNPNYCDEFSGRLSYL